MFETRSTRQNETNKKENKIAQRKETRATKKKEIKVRDLKPKKDPKGDPGPSRVGRWHPPVGSLTSRPVPRFHPPARSVFPEFLDQKNTAAHTRAGIQGSCSSPEQFSKTSTQLIETNGRGN
jgi:hypothetical protein